ncbi:type VII secretion protein EccB [Mycobacterium intermedium]|uniref:Type VII secretion protein EccB n=1 Tax=Mycobacterium intermedium TaxID=28445 RepID=A0A1E3S477_MYCIE|nr:type VII secretion protein EccB [Mycobacterium intermedium]MCV6967574.1 type VII secretion protein EccB [Mycobacterium intermedium]ODQ96983.1 type VII secretion protein EccB [Mycobacterium intermedium]OPE52769.1 type VII secretion protein EccB [Mycobacterium intermedium]ORB04128.1 type VII secretion protein EccB [Mycobacterium intermedium]
MPLNLSNRDQNSGHLFYNRRLRAAITRFSVRMKHDDRKQQAAVALSLVLVLLGVGWMALLHIMKPAGLVGQSAIIGNRDTGAVYARLNGRLYPALNLTSARLAVGNAAAPTWVTASEIAKYPTGPMIGIPGVPDSLPVANGGVSAWSVCDTASRATGSGPVVTAIAGQLTALDRAAAVGPKQAILVTHNGATHVIWGGQRSRIDPLDRSITFNLGLDVGVTHPIDISNALFDAMPSTEPLALPPIPEAGTASRWLPGASVGTVLQSRDAAGAINAFYVLLPDGVQKITGFVADLLRTRDSQGSVAPTLVAPDKLIHIPVVDMLDVDYFPSGRLEFVDTAANPVTCVGWVKQSGDPQARVTILSGRGLPVPMGMDARVVPLVRDDRNPDSTEAHQTLVLPGATNLIATTSGVLTADSRESLYWVSPQGVRYGIQSEPRTLQALGLDPRRAAQAPWPIVRTFASGPAISRAAALVARDAIPAGGSVGPIPDYNEAGS